jgi:hypothetical protein
MNNVKNSQNSKEETNKYKKPFYLMTLEDNNGECKQIKIYQNSDPFELSYNFCKENNLDFESMKYVKKNIKEIIKKFNEDEHYIMVEEEYYEDEDEDEDEDEYKKKINNNELKNNKNKKSTNELICSLVKKNIKLNHSKINKIAPLQKKINEDIQKIYKSKKKELFNSPDLAKENKNNNIFRNNNYHLLKNKIIYKVNKTIAVNDLKNKRYKLYKKNTSNDNKKMNTFSFKNEFCEYGVPELKSNNSINMIKYTSKIPKNKELSIVTKEENDEIKSGSRKFENEDDNEKNKSSSKEEIKKEMIDLNALNNKERENKFNCFHFNKMINNINNNNYNRNYNINNNNSININNNNIFNNINPINYNNKYLFNYINSRNLMEDIFNSKSVGKMKKLSNGTTRRILNDKFEESISFKTKIKNICKRMKKNMKKKNIISVDNSKSSENNNSKEKIKALLNDYKNSISKNKKI